MGPPLTEFSGILTGTPTYVGGSSPLMSEHGDGNGGAKDFEQRVLNGSPRLDGMREPQRNSWTRSGHRLCDLRQRQGSA